MKGFKIFFIGFIHAFKHGFDNVYYTNNIRDMSLSATIRIECRKCSKVLYLNTEEREKDTSKAG